MADGDTTTIATYGYWPDNRRGSKVVEHCGIEHVANDGGDTTICFYYGGNGDWLAAGGRVPVPISGLARWNIFETRNGSNQATREWVWGPGGMGVPPVGYIDELLLMDVNAHPENENDCDPDVTIGTEQTQQTNDRRFFYHQDRNWNVIALTKYTDGVGTNARLVERYAYTPYGEFIVLTGDAGSGEPGQALITSSVGSPFAHQGLPFDQEKGSYQNRHREYVLQRFAHRDPLAFLRGRFNPSHDYPDGMDLYTYELANPTRRLDYAGTYCEVQWRRHLIYVLGIPWGKYHVGVDIITDDSGFPSGHVDYGWSPGGNWFCCKDLVRWGARPGEPGQPPGVGVTFGEGDSDYAVDYFSDCMCNCLQNSPAQYGCRCGYGLFGVWPYSNSNGALHKAVESCEDSCGESHLLRPNWANDWTLPGWDHRPPDHTPGC